MKERPSAVPPSAPASSGPPPMLMTLADVAHELRCSQRQIWRLLSSGKMYRADVSFGGLRGRRWRRDPFEAWVRANCPRTEAWRVL